MTYKKPFIDAISFAFRAIKPVLVSPAMIPVVVVFAGFVLHSSFAIRPATQVILGGPSDSSTGMITTAKAAEAVAVSRIEFFEDELDGEIGPVIGDDSVRADAAGMFGFIEGASSSGADVYRIRPGDTFYRIAEAKGIDQKALRAANRKLEEPLIVGDVIILPITPVKEVVGLDTRRVPGSYLPAGFRLPAPGKIGPAHGRYDARDIPGPLGTSIVASGPGTVIAADYGWMGGYGNRIIIDHGNGLHTLYGHLNDLVVTIGQSVRAGDVIGFMGSTGRSTGSHIHFEVRWE